MNIGYPFEYDDACNTYELFPNTPTCHINCRMWSSWGGDKAENEGIDSYRDTVKDLSPPTVSSGPPQYLEAGEYTLYAGGLVKLHS